MSKTGIEVSLKELIELRSQVIHHPKENKNKWLKLTGQRLTRSRGRGLEFEATREYQAGDDIRSMAWRVTARSLKPHIKVYNEEKERPVWLAVDLSPSLYFGTRCMFKSVSIIKHAAYLGWVALHQHERIGAILNSRVAATHFQIHAPHASERSFLGILNSLAESSHLQPAFTEENHLQPLLLSLQQQAKSGNLIYILSDFFQFDAEIQKLILAISQRTQVVLIFVYDPFEAEAPPPHRYFLTNGDQKVLFAMNDAKARIQYQQQFALKKNTLIAFARQHHIALQILRTDQKQEDEVQYG